MLAVQIFSKEEERGKELAERLAAETGVGGMPRQGSRRTGAETVLIGPAPASIGRINDIFRFVFYVKSPEYDKLIQIKDILEQKIQKMPPSNETVQFDFDPINTL